MRFINYLLAMLILLLLSACGGGGDGQDTFRIGGSVQGLRGSLVLENNTTELLTISANGVFFFNQQFSTGNVYTVKVFQQPEGQFCSLVDNSGTVSTADITSIAVNCVNLFTVKGSIDGLHGSVELALTTAFSQEFLLASGDSFIFQRGLGEGDIYSVAIVQQPSGQICVLNNSSGVVSASGVPPVAVLCEYLSTALVTVSGVVTPTVNIVADSDLNDPLSNFSSNTTIAEAQELKNIVTVHGFASQVATSNFNTATNNRASDRFYDSTDRDDYFKVSLQAGQLIQLQVIDFDGLKTSSPFFGDLDLYLYNSQADLVAHSNQDSEFEELPISVTGDYYIDVYAFSGASKYVLKITSGNSLSAVANGTLSNRSNGEFVAKEAIVKFADSSFPLSIKKSDYSVSFRHMDVGRATLATFQDTVSSRKVSSRSEDKAMRELKKINPVSHEKVMTARRIKDLRQTPGIKFAEPNYLRYPMQLPNDQYYPLQWHYPAMNLPQAWDISTGTPSSGSVIVAVIDTGIVLNHPELDDKLVDGYDFIANDENSGDAEPGIDNNADDPGDGGSIGSSSWHGTHVAGTVAAESNNNIGVAGVSWGAKIMPLRALGRQGGTAYDIMQSLRFAAGLINDSNTLPAQTADIINLSVGGTGSTVIEAALYQQVYDLGIIVVAAAGNENTAQLSYPASYDGVISVSALDYNGNRAPYSNFGNAVDIAAPGGDASSDKNNDGQADAILSTLVDDSNGSREAIVAFYQGTSMATPHVAGMIALMKAIYPALTASEVDSLLQSGSLTNDIGEPGRDELYGFGSADALKAAQAAQSLAGGSLPPELPASVVSSPRSLTFGSSNVGELIITNQGGGTPTVTSVMSSESWLSVVSAEVDSFGLGSYQLSISRSFLNDGFYLGTITFHFDTAASLEVPVSMTTGQVESVGNLAKIYVMLYDPLTDSIPVQTLGVMHSDGKTIYTLSDVPAGRYILYAGTDIDNDGFTCQRGEGCGAYPSLAEPVTIDINGENISGKDFTTDIMAGFANLDNFTGEADTPPLSGIPISKESKTLASNEPVN